MTVVIRNANGFTVHKNVPQAQVNRLITMYSDLLRYGKQYADSVHIKVVQD